MSERIKLPGRIAFGSFLLLTASLAVQKPSIAAIAGKELSATDLIFPFVFIAVLVDVIATLKERSWKPVYFFFAAYITAFLIAAAFSADQTQALVKTFATAYLVFLAIVTIELVDSEKRLKLTALTLVAASSIPLLVGLSTIVLFYVSPDSGLLPYLTSHYGAVPVGNYPRISSTFVSASMFCNFLNVVLMLLVVSRSEKWIDRNVFYLALASVLICALFTISSSLGAVFLALGLWYGLPGSNKLLRCAALVVSVSACLLFFATGFIALEKHATAPYSFQVPILGIEAYPSPRLLIWTEALNNFFTRPVTGNGPGSRSAAVLFQNSEGGYSLLTDAHNSFLSLATQTGILGLAALVALVAYLLRIGFRRPHPTTLGIAIAFLTGFVVQGLMGSFEDARHLWLLLGLLVAAVNIKGQKLSGELRSSA